MIDEKLKDDEDLLDGYSGKWKGLYFLKGGESAIGKIAFDSEVEAAKYSAEWIKDEIEAQRRTPDIGVYIPPERTNFGRDVFVDELSHAIPMPVGESS